MGVKVSISIPDRKYHMSPGLSDQYRVSLCHRIPKDATYFSLKEKDKKMGGCFQMCQDLLSRVTLITKTFGRMWSFDTKIVAVSLIMISHMCSTINVYRICRNVKDWILKHQNIKRCRRRTFQSSWEIWSQVFYPLTEANSNRPCINVSEWVMLSHFLNGSSLWRSA